MPYLKITSNIDPIAEKAVLLKELTAFVAHLLGKSSRYVMVEMFTNNNMSFGSNQEPLAYVELKSIGLPIEKTKFLSKEISNFISTKYGIDEDRIYIEFSNVERDKWGWNGTTF